MQLSNSNAHPMHAKPALVWKSVVVYCVSTVFSALVELLQGWYNRRYTNLSLRNTFGNN